MKKLSQNIGTSTLTTDMIEVKRIWLEKDAVWIEISDGRTACEYFKNYPRLRNATEDERQNMQYDSFGIHWPDLDEDLSFEVFFNEKKTTFTFLYNIFMQHPEINVSAVARRLGMKQSLLAAYISGAKTPSELRTMEIVDCLNRIGKELMDIQIVDTRQSKVADDSSI